MHDGKNKLKGSKGIPENSIMMDKSDVIHDKTVSLESSPIKKQLYQEFNCAYGDEI